MRCYFDKVPFPTESMAQAEADYVNRSATRRHNVVAFQCQNCGAWHVGGEHTRPQYYLVRMITENEMDHTKIIKALIRHVIDSEGTDFLGMRHEKPDVDGLSEPERLELMRIRDEVRTAVGWTGYGSEASARAAEARERR